MTDGTPTTVEGPRLSQYHRWYLVHLVKADWSPAAAMETTKTDRKALEALVSKGYAEVEEHDGERRARRTEAGNAVRMER